MNCRRSRTWEVATGSFLAPRSWRHGRVPHSFSRLRVRSIWFLEDSLMKRNVVRMTIGMAVACAALMVTSSADAGLFGSHGGRGSFGGWGSGGGHGSNGSFGGLFRRHGSCGSHGGWGGCGNSCESSCEETKCEEAAPAEETKCEACEAEASCGCESSCNSGCGHRHRLFGRHRGCGGCSSGCESSCSECEGAATEGAPAEHAAPAAAPAAPAEPAAAAPGA